MFGFFRKQKPIFGMSDEALEKLLDEIEALIKQAHPDEKCSGKCSHKDEDIDKFMDLYSELVPRAFLLYGALADKHSENILKKVVAMMCISFCRKNSIVLTKL